VTAPDASRVVTFGETMALMRSQEPGPIAHAGSLRLGIGGAESNVAIGLARAGVAVTWAGRTGDDSFGELVRREIRAEGVHVHVTIDPSAPTGLMVKERRTVEQTRVQYYRDRSAGSRLEAKDLPHDHIRNAEILHLSGITPALSDTAREAAWSAVQTAKAAGTLISFDVNYRSGLWSPDEAAASLGPFINESDLVFAGHDEAAIVVGERSNEEALLEALSGEGQRTAVLKLGALGAVATANGRTFRCAANPVQPLDTVGAGDAFVAGYLAAILSGADIPAALRRSNAHGAYACLAAGDWEGSPRNDEWKTFEQHGLDPVTR
jgi:2-dehydro-3-deoxygluconokinase